MNSSNYENEGVEVDDTHVHRKKAQENDKCYICVTRSA